MTEIYAISGDFLSPNVLMLNQVRDILESGIKYYQYRCKNDDKNERLAREILELCNEFGAKFIVNDDVEFAKKIGANAVHIGKYDIDIESAKRYLGKDAFIGVSCYNDLKLAQKAAKLGASYVAFGSVFPSRTKPNATLVSLKTIKSAKETLDIPICAIGGINADNVSVLTELKVDLVAVINSLYKTKNIKNNILSLKKAMSTKYIF